MILIASHIQLCTRFSFERSVKYIKARLTLVYVYYPIIPIIIEIKIGILLEYLSDIYQHFNMLKY